MKYFYILSALFLLVSQNISAQLSIGFDKSFLGLHESDGTLSSDDIEHIKNTTTIFFYRPQDEAILAEMKQAFKSCWTISPLEFVRYDKAEEYKNKLNFTFISIVAVFYHSQSKSMSSGQIKDQDSQKFYLDFFFYKNEEKKGKKETVKKSFTWAVLDTGNLYPKESDNFFGITMFDLLSTNKDKTFILDLYEKAEIKNWNIPTLKAYLGIVNNALITKETRKFCNEDSDYRELQNLKNEELIISRDNFHLRISIFSKKDKNKLQMTDSEINDIMKDYPFPYKIVSAEEFNKLTINPTKKTYFLYQALNTNIFFIAESQTNKIIYSKCSFGLINLKNRLKELASVIKKKNK